MGAFTTIIAHDVRLSLRRGGDTFLVAGFFVLTVVLFPFGLGADADLLRRISPGIIWVTALLAAMLGLDRLFHADYEDGSLDLLALDPTPMELVVLAKAAAHWLVTGVPLLIAAPVLAVLLNMDGHGFGILVAALALGTPTLTLIGAIGAALTLGARRTGVLVSLLVLPLYIPVLIFGVAAVDAAIAGHAIRPQLTALAGFLLGALALAPFGAAAALRLAVR